MGLRDREDLCLLSRGSLGRNGIEKAGDVAAIAEIAQRNKCLAGGNPKEELPEHKKSASLTSSGFSCIDGSKKWSVLST